MRKRTKAATATNGHSLRQTPAKMDAVAVDQGHGLATIAAQLADLEDLYGLTCSARMAAERAAKPGPAGVYMPEQIEASRAELFFDDVNRRTHALTNTIQDLILQSEPRTLDETLSLALIYREQITLYLCDLTENPDSIKEVETQEREAKLDRAMKAILRGLVHGAGATSPLTAKYAHEEEDLTPWDEQRRKATTAAKRYPLKRDEEAPQ